MKRKKHLYRILSCLLVFAIFFASMPLTPPSIFAEGIEDVVAMSAGNTTEFAGGTGVEGDPYLIATKEHLNNVRRYLDACFKMTDDIVFTEADFAEGGAFYNDGKGWEPIGKNETNSFIGMFDGDNHTIKCLKITIKCLKITIKDSESEVYAGLFGYNKGTILNLGILDGEVSAATDSSSIDLYVGGVVGLNDGDINGCYNTGSVSASSSSPSFYDYYPAVGGIAGYNSGVISNCYNTGTVSSSRMAGGIVGCNCNKISNCYNTGRVSAFSYHTQYRNFVCAGGITGFNFRVFVISNCHNAGSVSASILSYSANSYLYAGGIAGYNDEYVCENKRYISNCYNTGSVSASTSPIYDYDPEPYAGGIAGYNDPNIFIKNCYNTGSVMSASYSSRSYAGGIVGYNSGGISNCYNTGGMRGTANAWLTGGIAGENNSGTISDCYYLNRILKGCERGLTDGTVECTEEELRQQQTFAGFDFDSVWTMNGNEAYPYPELQETEHIIDKEENTSEFAGGTGLPFDPYLISDKEQLDNVRNYLDSCFKMTADIEFTEADFAEDGAFYNGGKGWEPIGIDEEIPFFGMFDGDNHTIKGLKITIEDPEITVSSGLFGYNKGTVLNLGMLNGDVYNVGNFGYAGGIVGYNYGYIKNCYNTGSVSTSSSKSGSYAGGIAGTNKEYGVIINCHNTGNVSVDDYAGEKVSGDDYVGGIAGENSGTISHCHNTGDVNGNDYAGGVASGTDYIGGTAGRNSGFISECYNTGTVSAFSSSNVYAYAGGIAGRNSASICDCNNTGSVSASSLSNAYVGGIVGYNSSNDGSSTVSNCYNMGSLSASSSSHDAYAGGVAGYNYHGAVSVCYNVGSVSTFSYSSSYAGGVVGSDNQYSTISNCYNTGNVSSSSSSSDRKYTYAGGIAGYTRDGNISNCYNTGSVSASDYAGGIAGYNFSGTINNCYNTGNVEGGSYVGGIVGDNSSGTISDCYYLNRISKGCGRGSTDGTVKCTEEELRLQQTFAGFDFDSVWTMGGNEVYPYPELQETEHIIIDEENTSEFAGGTGLPFDPYLISTKEHLNNVRNYLDAYFKMTANIEFTEADFAEGGAFYNDGKGWKPIGINGKTPFMGIFYGDNHTIKGLKITVEDSESEVYAGLFGYNKGSILNLGMLDGSISTTGTAGGIAGVNRGDISNCYNTGSVSGGSPVGGITGENSGTINDCYNTGNVNGSTAGGIAGHNSGTISNCYNTGSVSASDYAGGITGYNNYYSGTINDCYNTGSVSASSKSSYYDFRAGGIAGSNVGDISNCYNTGSVRASSKSSYYDSRAGGITGENSGTINDCYNTGNVSASSSPRAYAGGIVGYMEDYYSETIRNCYYLDNISKGCGSGSTTGAIMCTEEELRLQKTFVGFDFDSVWTMDGDENYPYPELQNTPMTVPSYTHGDLDGDGIVDANDVYYLLQYTFYPDLYQLNQDCDFNKDGDVNADDVYYLLQYTFYPELYPLN